MVGRNNPLTTPQVCNLLALLTQYQDNLLFESNAAIDEKGVHVAPLYEKPLQSVSDCIKTISSELNSRMPLY